MVIIIDSNYLCYVAFFSIGGLKIDTGPTGVIFGFLSRILNLSEMFETNNFIFSWDSKHSIRKLKCPFYKDRHKDRTPEEEQRYKEAFVQFRQLQNEILPAIGFANIFQQPGYESDDIIAKLVDDLTEEIIVVTSDEDMYQLLFNCKIYSPSKKSIMTASRLWDEYEVRPAEWVSVKAIGGCTSDTIPPVAPGIGEKTAIKYVRNQLKESSAKFKAIKENRPNRDINDWLVRLPLSGTKSQTISENKFNVEEFKNICAKFRFNSFLENEGWSRWENFFKRGESLITAKLRERAMVKTLC